MKKNKLFNNVDSFFKLIYYFAKLNVLFWIYTIRGGVLFGFSPALVALIEVLSYKDVNETRINSRKTYHMRYKQVFRKANIVGGLLGLTALVFYFNYLAMVNSTVPYSAINVFAFLTVLVCYASVVIWVFPLMTKTDTSIKDLFKYALILGISHIHYTVFLLILLFSLLYLSLAYPALLLFFFYSVFSLIVLTLTSKPIEKVTI